MKYFKPELIDQKKKHKVLKGQDYKLFVGLGEKSYYFNNKKKAEKFLSSYSNIVLKIFDEFSEFHHQAYFLFVESLRYLSHPDTLGFNDKFSHVVDQHSRFCSYSRSDQGYYQYFSRYVNTIIDILQDLKHFYKKHSKFKYLAKKSRVLLRQCNFSIQSLDSLIKDYKPYMVEYSFSQLPVVTMSVNDQLKLVI